MTLYSGVNLVFKKGIVQYRTEGEEGARRPGRHFWKNVQIYVKEG